MAGGAAEGIEIKDEKDCDDKTCEACQLGKLHRSPFPGGSQTKREVLELIPTDIAGPILLATQSGKRIENAIRRPWTYWTCDERGAERRGSAARPEAFAFAFLFFLLSLMFSPSSSRS
jgi:hypothetical protein